MAGPLLSQVLSHSHRLITSHAVMTLTPDKELTIKPRELMLPPLEIGIGLHTDEIDPQGTLHTEAQDQGGLDTLQREWEGEGPDTLELWKKEEATEELKVLEETVTRHTKAGDKVG